MKRKIFLGIIIFIAVIIILIIIAIIYFNSGRIIFCRYEENNGFINSSTKIEIYNNGLIKKHKIQGNKSNTEYRYILKNELNEIVEIIKKIENSSLNQEEITGVEQIIMGERNHNYEFTNVNKNVVLLENNTLYKNSFVEELHTKINEIVNKKFK